VRRAARALGNALVLEKSWWYLARELGGRRVVGSYKMRSGSVIHLRHPDVDDWIMWEIFNLQMYRPPPEIIAHFERLHHLRVLDVGAHVGLFGRYVLDTIAGAEITSVEPSPANLRLLGCTASQESKRWRIIDAAAATSAGHARLTVPADGRMHFGMLSADGSCPVRTIDVFPLLADSDFAKIDIEGSEWPILADRRFCRDHLPPVLAIEFHPNGAPSSSPKDALVKYLTEAAEYTDVLLVQGTAMQGVAWAWDATRLQAG
jgi:FkbM family methyltransferase